MADVPAWLLVLQTVAAGGIGLAGSFIVPRSQRENRRAEALAASHAIMREKAEQIFSQISNSRLAISAALHRITRTISESDARTLVDYSGMGALHEIAGLVATYYPNGLPILENGRQELEAVISAAEKAISNAGAAGAIHTETGRLLHFNKVLSAHNVTSNCLLELERFMLRAVSPFAPVKEGN